MNRFTSAEAAHISGAKRIALLGRPMVGTLRGSEISNLKELRPRSGRDVAVRMLFVFDP